MFLKYASPFDHVSLPQVRYNAACDLFTLLFNLEVLSTSAHLPRLLRTLSPHNMNKVYNRYTK